MIQPRFAVVAALAVGLAGCSLTDGTPLRSLVAPGAVVDDAALAGDIRAAFGGVYADARLDQKLNEIAVIMADQLDVVTADYRVIVLDDPARMAFRAPGYRIFITRGLLALLNDSSEAAALLGFLIAETNDQSLMRAYAVPDRSGLDDLRRVFPADTAIGARVRKIVAPHFTREPLYAERLVRQVADAMLDEGWNPNAISRLAATMANARGIESNMAGGVSSMLDFPNRFRLDTAIAVADVAAQRERWDMFRMSDEPAPQRPETLLEAMSGMPVGPEADGAASSGGVLTHSGLGVTFRPPAGSEFVSESRSLVIFTPKGARVLIEGIDGLPPTDHLDSYLRDRPARPLDFLGRLRNLGVMRVGPYTAGVGEALVDAGGGVSMLMAAARLRRDSRMYEVMALWPRGLDAAGAEARAVLASMRPARGSLRPARIQTTTARDGASVGAYLVPLPFTDQPDMLFAIVNGLPPGVAPTPGRPVKTIRP